MLLRDVEVAGAGRVDVRVVGPRVVEIGRGLIDADIVDGNGAALLRGLHDHHCHLLAMAAALQSVQCGPPTVRDRESLHAALQTSATDWIRGIGYHESVAGHLDRAALDSLRADVPVRIQHRSGALWMLNSRGVDELGLDEVDAPGVERDDIGRSIGRLWRMDGWLRTRLAATWTPDLPATSQRLSGYGVTGVTDATPDLTSGIVELLSGAAVAQPVVLLGDPYASTPVKIVVPDHDLPSFAALAARVAAARPRAVAVHCVTTAALVLVLAVLTEIGTVAGDRIEHAAVAPPDTVAMIRALGLAVITQPSLPWRRGDDYLDGVEPEDRDALWPFRSFIAAGVPVGCSSDAPYGDPDPWASIRAAMNRRTASGRSIGAHERVSASDALRGYLSAPDDPGGPPRQVTTGGPADLVLLDAPLDTVLSDPSSNHVAMTLIGGHVAFQR